MRKKMINCKACGREIAKSAKACPHCGAKNKKPLFKKWWFWAIIVILFVAIGTSENDTENDTASTPNINNSSTENILNTEEITDIIVETVATTTAPSSTAEPTSIAEKADKLEYYVGDILEDGHTKIVFMSSGEYTEENDFLQPADGKKYIYLQFAFENTSNSNDTSISSYSFECFADGYAVDMYYGGEEDLSATLSAGRATTGFIYFEVPIDAEEIEIEYETNWFTDEKIKFIYEGEKDSGYVQQLNSAPTDGAHITGEVVESSKLKIAYLSCEEYVSDNMFTVPAEGYHFITCSFEFENIGNSDEVVSSFDFDCYADGLNCKGVYIRDDDLSATLSAGRKAKGTVTFEVPLDAEVVEVEYLSNYWTSNRVVFTAK